MSPSSSDPVLACPSCGLEHDPRERFCRECGMPLVRSDRDEEPVRSEAHERARKIRPEFTHGDLVRVAGGRNQAEAELIRNILLEEGVPSMVRRSAGFDVPDFLAAGQRDVLVPASGVQTARDVLHSADIRPAPESTGGGPTRTQVLAIVAALLIGAALTALIAWLLVSG
jgi:hypothetical protein